VEKMDDGINPKNEMETERERERERAVGKSTVPCY
jgi:hypothetical protein